MHRGTLTSVTILSISVARHASEGNVYISDPNDSSHAHNCWSAVVEMLRHVVERLNNVTWER